LLLFESLQLAALAVQFSLVRINLALLIGLSDFLALELISNQCSAAQTEGAADGCPGSGMADRSSDETSGGGAAQSPDSCSLFTRGE
jgi:hypothetical protein